MTKMMELSQVASTAVGFFFFAFVAYIMHTPKT